MHYYEVAVASTLYHGINFLTYECEAQLTPGMVVVVPMRKKHISAIVIRSVDKPKYPTRAIIRTLFDSPVPQSSTSLLAWLMSYYPAPLGVITQLFLPPALLKKTYRTKDSLLLNKTIPSQPLPPLTSEQKMAANTIVEGYGSFLLHGDTGTGKTRVYQELAAQTLAQGKSVIVLTPEIGLTPQLVKSFETAFPGKVLSTHSNISAAKRRSIWIKTLGSPTPLVVIGPRSALFMPLHNTGLIIMDEAHETSYKQDSAPYYQTSRVAAQLAKLSGARFVMGTATPLVSEYFLAHAKHIPIIRMTDQPLKRVTDNTPVSIVDIKDRTQFTRQAHISNVLLDKINESIADNAQALVFLNRRGTARLILCTDCSWEATCQRCDTPLTYHADKHDIRCHTCGYKTFTPTSCPECKGVNILFRSVGTKAIVDELQKEFPEATILRFDTDSLGENRLEQRYDDLVSGKVDIIVGTQMLAKGLDLPRLAVVGVIAADTSLYFPDYTADERTYQLLHQVIGRVGRGHRQGSAVIQTYRPESKTLAAVIKKKWDIFYEDQLRERELYNFPPFCHVLKLTCERATPGSAESASTKLATMLSKSSLRIEVIGPTPAFHEKTNNRYKWQLVVKSKNRRHITEIIPLLPAGWTYNLDPNHLL